MNTATVAELTEPISGAKQLASRPKAMLAVVLTLAAITSACGRTGDDDGPSVAGDSIVAPTTQPVAATPAPTTAPIQITYVVQSGDTLSVIAARFGVGTKALADFNAIADVNTLQVGQQLNIPPSTTPTTAPTQTTAPAASPTAAPTSAGG